MAEALRAEAPLPFLQPEISRPALVIRGLSVDAKNRPILRQVDLEIPRHQVLGIIGPSGAGKSTLLKTLNRLVDLESPSLAVSGRVELDGRNIYDRSVDADEIRARIGILFQRPVVFPCSIFHNVLFGVRRVNRLPRRDWQRQAERSLCEAALWDEVKDRLDDDATTLSVGQQQRLCLARTLALEPEVILMDEPTSALDPRATQAIEELIIRLKRQHTVVLVTHDPAQARRVTDSLACLCVCDGAGELLESGPTEVVFRDSRCCAAIHELEGGPSDVR
jgi:phosphate transport system ATP-binding protein